MNPSFRTLSVAVAAAVLCGCVLFQKKDDLEQVHNTYRSEFASTFLGEEKFDPSVCKGVVNGSAGSFPKTLQAIRDYDVKYGKDESTAMERAHLTILKGMIHLQVGNTGIAESMADEVTKAPIAATDDREVRDSLFQKAFRNLIVGWRAVCDRPKSDSGKRFDALIAAGKGVLEVANGQSDAASKGMLATDEGAIYLATSGAIFLRHAYQIKYEECFKTPPLDDNRPIRCGDSARKASGLAAGTEAIGNFLSADEKKAAGSASDAENWMRIVPLGRVQYVQWYGRLSSEAPAK